MLSIMFEYMILNVIDITKLNYKFKYFHYRRKSSQKKFFQNHFFVIFILCQFHKILINMKRGHQTITILQIIA